MIELFRSHGHIERENSVGFESAMIGHGPLFNRKKKGKDLVSFYTYLLKVKDLIKT